MYNHQNHSPNAPLPTWHASGTSQHPSAYPQQAKHTTEKLTSDIEDVKAPFCYARLVQVFTIRNQCTSRRIASRRANFDEIIRQEESREVGQNIDDDGPLGRRYRASPEQETKQEREDGRDEETKPELLDSCFVLISYSIASSLNTNLCSVLRHAPILFAEALAMAQKEMTAPSKFDSRPRASILTRRAESFLSADPNAALCIPPLEAMDPADD